MKNTFVTAEFKKYIKNSFKKNTSVVTEIDDNVYYLATDHFVLRTDAVTFNMEILPALNMEKIPNVPFNHSGYGCSSPKYIYETIAEGKKIVSKTPVSLSLPAGNKSYFVDVFKCENNGILIKETFLSLFNLEESSLFSAGRPIDPVLVHTPKGSIVICPVRCPANSVNLVNAIVSAS